MGLTNYEVWVTEADGSEYVLFSFYDNQGLDDASVKTAASTLLQTIIDKIATPTPDTIVVKRGMVYPPAYPLRGANIEGKLDQ